MFAAAPHLVFMLGIFSVGLASESVLLGVLFCGVYAVGLYVTERKKRGMGKNTEAVLAVLAVIVSTIMTQLQGRPLIAALQYWLMCVLVLRAFRKKTKRDYAFCFLASAGLYAHIGRTYTDVRFLFLTLAYLIVVPYALFYFLVRYGGFQKDDLALPPVRLRFKRSHVRFMSGVSGALMVAAVLVFLVMPRPPGSALLPTYGEDNPRRFRETVSLGDIDSIREHGDIVMAVETDKPTLWRGSALDYYEDGVWYETARFQRRHAVDKPPYDPAAPTVTRRFEMFDVRMTSYELFSAGNIISVRRPQNRWVVWINDLYSSVTMHPRYVTVFRGKYEVVSQDAEFLGYGTLARRRYRLPTGRGGMIAEADLFLQVPRALSPRVRELAQSLTRDRATIEDKAKAVVDHLSSGFTYSLTGLHSGEMPPLEYFLFKSRQGHCEYFASAMAMLLRCAGVRSRVVRGFTPGTYVDGKYVVRLKDAHLWTEVFYPGKGWKAYDPTASSTGEAALQRRMGFLEKMQLKWQTWVLQYDGVMQAKLFGALRNKLIEAIRTFRRALPRWKVPVLAALGLAVIAALAWLLRLLGLRFPGRWRPSIRPRAGMKARGYFRRYLREIARRGYRRLPGTTPNDLIAALEADDVPILPEARFLTDLFHSIRFGGAEPSAPSMDQSRRALTRIRQWAK
jgi:transglutaminase-like putative cysteine protease